MKKLAIINTYDARDIKMWSGIPYHLGKMFETIIDKDSIEYIALPLKRSCSSYIKGFYFNRIKKRNFLSFIDQSFITDNTLLIQQRSIGFKLIITFEFFLVDALKHKDNKVFFWNDATFNNLSNFYSYVSNLADTSFKSGQRIQKLAIEKSDAIILSSDWAINSAINDYGADTKKIKKVHFASNLSIVPAENEVKEIINSRDRTKIKLLFLAVDWERKGGDDAVAIVENLNNTGFKAELIVVGTTVPKRHKNNRNINSFGFINKYIPTGESKLIDFLKSSTFLILPTRADCTPVAFSEANSYGLPVITTDVGGIPSIIKSNINGVLFGISVFVNASTSYIKDVFLRDDLYNELCLNSYKYYQKELAWEHVKGNFIKLLEEQGLDYLIKSDT